MLGKFVEIVKIVKWSINSGKLFFFTQKTLPFLRLSYCMPYVNVSDLNDAPYTVIL